MVLSAALMSGGWSLLFLGVYPVQIGRIAMKGKGPMRENWLRAAFLVLGKFPEAVGLVKFLLRSATGGPVGLIEYK